MSDLESSTVKSDGIAPGKPTIACVDVSSTSDIVVSPAIPEPSLASCESVRDFEVVCEIRGGATHDCKLDPDTSVDIDEFDDTVRGPDAASGGGDQTRNPEVLLATAEDVSDTCKDPPRS